MIQYWQAKWNRLRGKDGHEVAIEVTDGIAVIAKDRRELDSRMEESFNEFHGWLRGNYTKQEII